MRYYADILKERENGLYCRLLCIGGQSITCYVSGAVAVKDGIEIADYVARAIERSLKVKLWPL